MGDALVVPGVRPGNAVNEALEPRRLGPRELGVGQVVYSAMCYEREPASRGASGESAP